MMSWSKMQTVKKVTRLLAVPCMKNNMQLSSVSTVTNKSKHSRDLFPASYHYFKITVRCFSDNIQKMNDNILTNVNGKLPGVFSPQQSHKFHPVSDILSDPVTLVQSDCSPQSDEEGDWGSEMEWVRSEESGSVLDPPQETSDIDMLAPQLPPTFNFAAYVNQSSSLQQLVKLGVDLSQWEKRKGICEHVLRLNFDADMKDYIMLLHDVGVAAEDLGRWLTINPYIFRQTIDNLNTRINYLQAMKFTDDQIAHIVARNPYWLLFSTTRIDGRLGFFQRSFELMGGEVRQLATTQPKLITQNMNNIKRTSFAIHEEMGFTKSEMKQLLLAKPKLWRLHGPSLLSRFIYAHNSIGFTHLQLLKHPEVLLTREFRLKQRHLYLKSVFRDQYDPTKPNYVSPKALVCGSDADFCLDIAKTSVQSFNDFLKTL